jgi:hypothetical protein
MKFTRISDEIRIHGFDGYTPIAQNAEGRNEFRLGRGVRQELIQTRVCEGADGLMIQRAIRRLR